MSDRPGDRAGADAEHFLDLVQVVERLAPEPVHLVDESEDGDPAAAADLEELAGLGFDAFRAVDQHHRRVGRRQRAVGVLGEILVAGRVEQVDAVPLMLELQHARSDGNPALPFQLHPVGGDVPLRAARLDRAREMNRAAMEQQLFRQRRLARIRMRDDRKRPPPRRLRFQLMVGSLGHGASGGPVRDRTGDL